MQRTILSRYLDPQVLNQVAQAPLQPHGLVLGNLAGEHRSPLAGFAVEFAGHREYAPGDDLRHLDWRVYYRREKLFIKQYDLETNFVAHLVLDTSASMRYGQGAEEKWNYAARAAMTLAYMIVRQSDKVGLLLVDRHVRAAVPPGSALPQIVRMSQTLDEAPRDAPTDLAQALLEVAGRLGRRQIVLIFSDFFTDLTALEHALQRLRYDGHDVVLLQVLHPDERHFQLHGQIRFVPLEEGTPLQASADDLRPAYLRALADHEQRLEAAARRNRCEWVRLDSGQSLAGQLLDYLHRQTLSPAHPA
jgi:uncharacterized protein (DUF58 family)